MQYKQGCAVQIRHIISTSKDVRNGQGTSSVRAERFKTRAGHFPIQHDERTGIQRATLGKSGSEAPL